MAVQQSPSHLDLTGRVQLLGDRPQGIVTISAEPGTDPSAAVEAGRAAAADGAPPVVVEWVARAGQPGPTAHWVQTVSAAGLLPGIVLAPTPADATDEEIGGEIGLLTQALGVGVRTVRGADPVRFRRVRAVVEALAAVEAGA